MAAISTRAQSRAGLVAMGATILKMDGVTPLGVQSYDYNGYFKALTTSQPQAVTYPCIVAWESLENQPGYKNLAFNGSSPQIKFSLLHFLLISTSAGAADYRVQEPVHIAMNDHYDQALKAFTANGGWAAVSHGPVDLVKRVIASKLTWEGTVYNASIFEYAITLNL